MKKIKILLRYGLACSALTISGSVANAQNTDEPAESLPPIVQVAPEEEIEQATELLSDATSEEDCEQCEPSSSEAPIPFNAEASPFRLQPLKPILEAVPIVQMAPDYPNDDSSFPMQAGNLEPDGQLPPIVTATAQELPKIVQSTTRPNAREFQQQFVPPRAPIYSGPGSDVPTFFAGAPSLPSAKTNSASKSMSNYSAPRLPATNLTTDFQQQATMTTQETRVETQPFVEPTRDVGGSGYDSRGRCAHCGGVGCDHCSGATPQMTYDLGSAPVMGYESAILPSAEVHPTGPAYDCCGFMNSIANHYLFVDFLYYQRADDTVFGGNFSRFDDFDWTRGGRATFGKRRDSNSGHEISLTGFDPWIAVTTETDAAGGLSGNLVAAGGFPSSSLSAFRDSTFLEQLQKTKLYSGEFNRTYWGWDVVKNFIGVRYIYFDDEYRLSSANAFGEQGYYFLDTTNYLFGPHIGSELFYDVGYRLSFSFSAKLGGYANVHRGRTAILNDGDVVLNATDKDTSWAASAEIGLHGHYQILPRVRARFGYDVLGLWNVATTADNFTQVITPTTGRTYEDDGDAFFHGVFAGVEFYR